MYITDVRDVADGYVIEFSNGETITIRHGEDGEDGTDGKDGDSFFSSVEVGDEYVIFTLTDGTSFQIPLEKPLDIIFDVEDMEETVLSSYVDLEIKYTVQSSAADISIEVITEGDIKATLNRTDELNGVITVCAEGLESVEGCKIVVLVGDERRVIMRSITFADLKVSVSDVNTISVPAEGATVNIYYMANQDCSVFDIFCPEWITVLETKAYTELTYINLTGAEANGSIPAEIGNLAKLEVLSIYNTGISGSIPASLGNCTELRTLWLDNNALSGSIPAELAGCTNLEVIMLHRNSLSGEIPEAIGRMPSLKRISLLDNELSGAIPQSLQDNNSLWKYCWGYIVTLNDFDPESFEVPEWDFTVQDINGRSLNSETVYAEHEYTVMLKFNMTDFEDFIDDFSALYDEYSGRLEIIGYSASLNAQELSRLAADYSISFPLVAVSEDNPIIAVDEEIQDWGSYNWNFPSSMGVNIVVVDNKGDVVYYDLDHRLSYSINNLKAFLQTATGLLYESADFSRDGKYEILQQATIGKGIDIVIMGDGYSDRLMETFEADAVNVMEQIFSVEPYRSFREYFNVYRLDLVSVNEMLSDITNTALGTKVYGENVSYSSTMVVRKARQMFSGLGDESRMDNAVLIALLNHENVAGDGSAYHPDNENDHADGTGLVYVARSDGGEASKAIFLWKFGFAFSKLASERGGLGTIGDSSSDNIRQLMESYGWYKNLDFTSDPTLVKWAEFIADERYAGQGLGVFEGGYGYDYGVWRPSRTSIMSGDLAAGYNAPSREAIYYRIHKLAYGADWEYDYEAFVAYDEVNRSTSAQTSATRTYVLQPAEMPELKVIPMTWREALENSVKP